jgi:hypothetical protein
VGAAWSSCQGPGAAFFPKATGKHKWLLRKHGGWAGSDEYLSLIAYRLRRRVVKAEPLDACSGLARLPNELQGAVVVALRGACGFGDKALNAQRAGASAVVFVDRPGSALLRIGATHDQVRSLWAP